MDPFAAGLQVLGILKGGSAPPVVTSGAPAFNNQMMDLSNRGIALPSASFRPEAQAFQTRPSSYVMGLTGLSTTGAGAAIGNGTAVVQPVAITNSILQNRWMWAAVAVVGIAFVFKGKK